MSPEDTTTLRHLAHDTSRTAVMVERVMLERLLTEYKRYYTRYQQQLVEISTLDRELEFYRSQANLIPPMKETR